MGPDLFCQDVQSKEQHFQNFFYLKITRPWLLTLGFGWKCFSQRWRPARTGTLLRWCWAPHCQGRSLRYSGSWRWRPWPGREGTSTHENTSNARTHDAQHWTGLLTRLVFQSPSDEDIRAASVSIWVMLHLLMSLTLATRDAGPKIWTWSSGMVALSAYACKRVRIKNQTSPPNGDLPRWITTWACEQSGHVFRTLEPRGALHLKMCHYLHLEGLFVCRITQKLPNKLSQNLVKNHLNVWCRSRNKLSLTLRDSDEDPSMRISQLWPQLRRICSHLHLFCFVNKNTQKTTEQIPR